MRALNGLLIVALFSLTPATAERARVYLLSVPVLVFTQTGYTTARRGVPVSQLQCVGGAARGQPERYPKHVECYNVGIAEDGSEMASPRWRCVAGGLEDSYYFESWTVQCEGWSYDGDPYVVEGSCWCEYTLGFGRRADRAVANESAVSEEKRIVSSGAGLGWRGWALVVLFVCSVAVFIARRGKRNRDVHVLSHSRAPPNYESIDAQPS